MSDKQVALYDGLMPVTIGDKMAMARIVADSGICPKSLDTPAKVFIALQTGHELGMSPMMSVNNISAINGRVVFSADLMMGLCRNHPEWGGISEKEINPEGEVKEYGLSITIKRRKGDIQDEFSETFTWKDAEKAGLTKKAGPWQDYPKRMIGHRARAYACRRAFPDVLSGLYTPDEVEGMPHTEQPVQPSEPKVVMSVEDEIKAMVAEALAEGWISQEVHDSAISKENMDKYRSQGKLADYRDYLKQQIRKSELVQPSEAMVEETATEPVPAEQFGKDGKIIKGHLVNGKFVPDPTQPATSSEPKPTSTDEPDPDSNPTSKKSSTSSAKKPSLGKPVTLNQGAEKSVGEKSDKEPQDELEIF